MGNKALVMAGSLCWHPGHGPENTEGLPAMTSLARCGGMSTAIAERSLAVNPPSSGHEGRSSRPQLRPCLNHKENGDMRVHWSDEYSNAGETDQPCVPRLVPIVIRRHVHLPGARHYGSVQRDGHSHAVKGSSAGQPVGTRQTTCTGKSEGLIFRSAEAHRQKNYG